jgi:hypothetical protein
MKVVLWLQNEYEWIEMILPEQRKERNYHFPSNVQYI